MDLRSGYASLDITISRGMNSVTRMEEVGPHGVNYRLTYAIRELAQRISRGGMTPAEALSEMTRLKQDKVTLFVRISPGIELAVRPDEHAFTGFRLTGDWSSLGEHVKRIAIDLGDLFRIERAHQRSHRNR